MQHCISSCRPRLAVLAVLVLLTGCLGSNVIRFETGEFGQGYVTSQLTSAMENVGYRQVAFRDFRTKDQVKRQVRTGDEIETRFLRRGTPTFIALVFFDDRRSVATVRLTEDGNASLSETGARELELVRASLRETFGPRMVP